MCEKLFYNLVLDGYKMLVKIQKDKEEGYEEFFVDRIGVVWLFIYDSYLEIIE